MSDQTNSKESVAKPKSVEVPIEYMMPEGMLGVYSDNLLVQHTENEFLLTFFQLNHVARLGPVEAPASIPAQCVARIIMHPKHFEAIVETLNRNLARFKARQTGKEEEAE